MASPSISTTPDGTPGDSSGGTPDRPLRTRPYALIVAVFLLIEVTGIFEQTMIYVALPTLMGVFETDAATISWGITVFLLVGAGTAAISGRLGDIYGRKKVLVVLMVVSTVGSFVSVIFGNFEGILIGRALQGTSAALFPLLVGIAREVVPAPRVPVLIALTTGSAVIGGSLGALAAGILLESSGWHSMFVASGILALLALFSTLLLPPSIVAPAVHGRLDILGGVLLAPAVAAVLFGVNTARGAGVTPLTVILIVGGLALFAGWIVLELRLKEPMFNLRLFTQRPLVLALLITALVGLGIFATGALLNPILLQGAVTNPVGLGLTPTTAGLYGLITGAIGFVLSPIGGKVAAKYGAKITLIAGIAVAVVGFGGFAFFVHDLALALVASVVSGVGTSLILAGLPNLIVELVPPENTGEAVGMIYSVGRTLFQAIATAVAGLILSSSVVEASGAPTSAAWYGAVGFIAVTGILAMIITAVVKKVTPMDQRGDVIEAVVTAPAATPADSAAPTATALRSPISSTKE
ncbi:MFS transporter [Microbacteriaceae bacterium VKM Ac-2854]|nr:MFS transporter [Microbacteriaceae bacterium VKM Ac-2854]